MDVGYRQHEMGKSLFLHTPTVTNLRILFHPVKLSIFVISYISAPTEHRTVLVCESLLGNTTLPD